MGAFSLVQWFLLGEDFVMTERKASHILRYLIANVGEPKQKEQHVQKQRLANKLV